ncbi:serine/threonine-protein kinase haspin-like [Rhipicephalus microplus]|uniref:serine/threonine-protein kinase haspin-like n=1 Tax=Rhipicephalus microplus TaxID=6941 RepID=UPI003F6C9BD5
MLFTLATVYGGRNASRSASETSWRRFAESYPLVDQRPLLLEHGSLTQRLLDSTDDDDDDEQGAVGSDEEDVHTSSVESQRDLDGNRTRSANYAPSEISEGPRSARWSLPGDLPEVIIKSKQSVKRPIEVFPSRLLDLCNQDAPLTFLAFLPNGNQHRSKWLAHGRNSEVFQVTSVPRRTVLKVVPVSGDLTEQQVDTIASAIKCYLKLSMLKHGTHYRTPNFIEVERIACVFDQFPEWLLRSGNKDIASSSESLNESLASEMAGADGGSPDASDLLAAFRRWKGTNQCCLTRHFIVFELSYAGKPLSRITLRSAVQGRSLVQQAACCLAVAERALGFRHTGVDADKLLVAMTDAASLEYRLPNRTTPISIESAGLKAHLAGCLSFAIDSEGTFCLHSL